MKPRLLLKTQGRRQEAGSFGTCAVCDGSLQAQAIVRVGNFRLMACEACGSWTSWPRPSAEAQAALHDADAYSEHPYLVHRRANTRALEKRCLAIFERIRSSSGAATLKGERILDVGCDTGQFVAVAARNCGAVPVGVDVARSAVAEAVKAGVDAHATSLEDAPPALCDFPVITAIDLIEHVADPASLFRSIRDRLRPGGVAYVETPNLNSFVYRVGRLLCAVTRGRPLSVFRRLFPPEHVQYFSVAGLRELTTSSGLDLMVAKSRVLPTGEIAVGWFARAGLFILQCLDRLTGNKALLWALLRRPDAPNIAKAT
jgi:SAM-dependent methyltransferase